MYNIPFYFVKGGLIKISHKHKKIVGEFISLYDKKSYRVEITKSKSATVEMCHRIIQDKIVNMMVDNQISKMIE